MEDEKKALDKKVKWPVPFALVKIQGKICPIPITSWEEAAEIQKAINEDEAEIARKKSLSHDT